MSDHEIEFMDLIGEDDEYEMDMIFAPIQRNKKLRDRLNPMETLNDLDFLNKYHITKELLRDVVFPICKTVINDNRGAPVPDILKVLTFLRYLVSGSYQFSCGDNLALSQPMVSNLVGEMASKLTANYEKFVKFPSNEQMPNIEQEFYKIAGFPGICGLIDCTHIPIKSPGGTNSEDYRCKNGFMSLNVQIVCGPDLQFYDIVCKWPGSTSDRTIFENSSVKERFENHQIKGHLLGHSGYAQTSYMFTPYLNPVSSTEQAYNLSLKNTRHLIKKSICIFRNKFPILNKRLHTKFTNSMNIITAASVLHNITGQHNSHFEHPNNQSLNELPEHPVEVSGQGVLIRQQFACKHFARGFDKK